MDVYSFAMLMWELFHEKVPFDSDVQACTRIICDEQSRPRISQVADDGDSDESPAEEEDEGVCTKPIAEIIRKCWTQVPDERPNFNWVIEKLAQELSYFKTDDE